MAESAPYSEDHLSELSYRELSGPLLWEAGLQFVVKRPPVFLDTD